MTNLNCRVEDTIITILNIKQLLVSKCTRKFIAYKHSCFEWYRVAINILFVIFNTPR